MRTNDPFNLRIVLRHPSYTPEHISKALSLKPDWSHEVGEMFAKRPAKRTNFYGSLRKGRNASGIPGALTKVVRFLKKKDTFWNDFVAKGEVELVLNFTMRDGWKAGDKCFELFLAPVFLANLSKRGIGLTVQGWQQRVKPRADGAG